MRTVEDGQRRPKTVDDDFVFGRPRPSLTVLLIFAMVPEALLAQAHSRFRPDERVIIADFSRIDAVAVGRTTVFAATPNGLVVYDRRFGRWGPPITASDGYPPARAVAAVVDPADESLWLATRTGLLHYRPALGDVEELVVPGGVSDLAFDRDDPMGGLYLRGVHGWEFLGRGQLAPQPAGDLLPRTHWIGPLSLATVLQRFPLAATMGVSVLIDRQLRQYHYTAAAIAPEGSEVFFGTDGLGLVRLDATTARLERLPFGFSGSRIGAVAPDADGVWVGVDELSGRGGFARVNRDLSSFEEERDAGFPLRRIRDIAVLGRVLWAATDRGLLKVEPGGRWRGAGGDAVLSGPGSSAVAAAPNGVWAGSDRGLALVREDGGVTRVGPVGLRVLALHSAGDSVWVGTVQGLLLAVGETGELRTPVGSPVEPLLSGPIVALARSGAALVAATPDRIIWRRNGAAWTVERVISSELGTISSLAADSGGVWVGAEAGMAFYRFSGRGLVTFRAPDDVPGPVRDLAVSGGYLWVATDRGLVRFARQALVP